MTTATTTKRKPAIYKIDDEVVVARAMEILEARMYQSGPVMDNPGAVKDYLRMKSNGIALRKPKRSNGRPALPL